MKPDVKYITPYLPYNLQIQTTQGVYTLRKIDTMSNVVFWINASYDIDLMSKYSHVSKDRKGIQVGFKLEEIKPLLKPLDSLLTDCPEEIRDEFSEWEWDVFTNRMEFRAVDPIDRIPVSAFMKMIELHYDVFQLIPQGLALDINTFEL